MTQTDITTRTVLLTGSTSGIGERMLHRLADHAGRPDIVLLARDTVVMDRQVASLRGRGLAARGIHINLSDLESVSTALDEIAAAQERGDLAPIDVALLNAGSQFASRRKAGAQGHELTFSVNVIAQHLMLRGLEPRLAAGANAIVMGSSTHRGARASFNLVPDPEWREPALLAQVDGPSVAGSEDTKRGGVAYATSKLALVTLSHDWAERFGAAGRRLNTYDPGLVPGTGLGKDMQAYRYWVWKYLMPAMRVLPGATTAVNTARHAVELVMGDVFADLNDGYVEIGRVTRAEAVTFERARRDALWEWLEVAVREYAPQSDVMDS